MFMTCLMMCGLRVVCRKGDDPGNFAHYPLSTVSGTAAATIAQMFLAGILNFI